MDLLVESSKTNAWSLDELGMLRERGSSPYSVYSSPSLMAILEENIFHADANLWESCWNTPNMMESHGFPRHSTPSTHGFPSQWPLTLDLSRVSLQHLSPRLVYFFGEGDDLWPPNSSKINFVYNSATFQFYNFEVLVGSSFGIVTIAYVDAPWSFAKR